jgi:hypothetical protein
MSLFFSLTRGRGTSSQYSSLPFRDRKTERLLLWEVLPYTIRLPQKRIISSLHTKYEYSYEQPQQSFGLELVSRITWTFDTRSMRLLNGRIKHFELYMCLGPLSSNMAIDVILFIKKVGARNGHLLNILLLYSHRIFNVHNKMVALSHPVLTCLPFSGLPK